TFSRAAPSPARPAANPGRLCSSGAATGIRQPPDAGQHCPLMLRRRRLRLLALHILTGLIDLALELLQTDLQPIDVGAPARRVLGVVQGILDLRLGGAV